MCDSDKEVEDIKTEENVENDEASTETEDCERRTCQKNRSMRF